MRFGCNVQQLPRKTCIGSRRDVKPPSVVGNPSESAVNKYSGLDSFVLQKKLCE